MVVWHFEPRFKNLTTPVRANRGVPLRWLRGITSHSTTEELGHCKQVPFYGQAVPTEKLFEPETLKTERTSIRLNKRALECMTSPKWLKLT